MLNVDPLVVEAVDLCDELEALEWLDALSKVKILSAVCNHPLVESEGQSVRR